MPIKELKEGIKEAISKTTDPEVIASLAKLEEKAEQCEKEEEKALEQTQKLREAYRDAVLNSKFPDPKNNPQPAPGEDHKDEELSFDGLLDKAIKDTLSKKKED